MNQDIQKDITNNNTEISVKDIIRKIKSGISYLKSQWLIILIFFIVGAGIGLAYSIVKKTTYTAVCTFVLEEGDKQGGLGQYSSLASLAGINIGSAGGIFQGDNILELYKSHLMIEKTLLSKVNINGHDQLLIDRYVDFTKMRKSWRENDKIDSINFNGDPSKFNRKQDSIITALVEFFNKKILNVGKPDKKLDIIEVAVTSKDELFSKAFTDKIVETVNNFYIQTKTKNASQNVQILQKQADSVRSVLNSSISGVASAIDATPNANPQQLVLKVPSQKRQIDVQSSGAVYSEIVKNLEIAKISLLQSTPLIQIIDQPVLPLAIDHLSKLKGIIIGGFLSTFLIIFGLIIKRLYTIIS